MLENCYKLYDDRVIIVDRTKSHNKPYIVLTNKYISYYRNYIKHTSFTKYLKIFINTKIYRREP